MAIVVDIYSGYMIRRGFTLIEMLIVISLMAIILGISVFGLGNQVDRIKFNIGVENLLMNYQQVYTRSFSESSPIMMTFDTLLNTPIFRAEDSGGNIIELNNMDDVLLTQLRYNGGSNSLAFNVTINQSQTLQCSTVVLINPTSLGTIGFTFTDVNGRFSQCYDLQLETCKLMQVSCD